MRQFKIITDCLVLTISLMAITLLVAAVASLQWRYQHDSPLMIYSGFLVANGRVPYRDFFDMNVPGVHFVMAVVGTLAGWNDLAFRVFDMFCLATISISTYAWLRRFGKLSAFMGAVVFPLFYLSHGPSMSLQREYIALVPFTLMLAIAAATAETEPASKGRMFILGALAGVSILIKPQFLLFSLPIIILRFQVPAARSYWRHQAVSYLGGLLLPVFTACIYLAFAGGLTPFLDMAINYWPLYTHMTGDHRPIAGLSRLFYILLQTALGTSIFWLPMAVIGLIALAKNHTQFAWFLASLIGLSILYPGISGQFWPYHWLPFYYIILSTASLCTRLVQFEEHNAGAVASAAALIFSLLFLLFIAFANIQSEAHLRPPKGGAPDEIAAFLRSHMKPGDTVQPLDWTGGAVHGMLMARAPLATKFMYDFHFYHHITHPYIRRLRFEFMTQLCSKKPRFIIQILQDKPWPHGPDTTQEFPELHAFLRQHYIPVRESAQYRIFQRKD